MLLFWGYLHFNKLKAFIQKNKSQGRGYFWYQQVKREKFLFVFEIFLVPLKSYQVCFNHIMGKFLKMIILPFMHRISKCLI